MATKFLPWHKENTEMYPQTQGVDPDEKNNNIFTELIGASVRRSHVSEHPLFSSEQDALHKLNLQPEDRMLVITRAEKFQAQTIGLQHSYLDPSKFPGNFLDRHNFAEESLPDIYCQYGYLVGSYDYTMYARTVNVYETSLLIQRYRTLSHIRVVLDVERVLWAASKETGERFVLEFFKGSYFDGYNFEIRDYPVKLPA